MKLQIMIKKTKNIIPEKSIRDKLMNLTRDFIFQNKLTPPLSSADVYNYSEQILLKSNLPDIYKDFQSVLVGSLVWEETLAMIPYERRILLLPLCLRSSTNCSAELDEFGLLCLQCGNCTLGTIQKKAEDLGYVVLVAEGTTVVTKLIESGQVEAVIGVSCLSSLERSFPYITKAAIPAVAIPLIKDECIDTIVDTEWLKETIDLKDDIEKNFTFDYKSLRNEIDNWFQKDNLSSILNIGKTDTETIALEWLGSGGKRWRPFLTVSTYQALTENYNDIPKDIKKLAISVECFHKASLVHDDIEDNDSIRYENLTLHEQHNVPIAINIGDLLMGIGYQLIAETNFSSDIKSRIFREVAKAHTTLCIGQGEELGWLKKSYSMKAQQIIEIFRKKTSPAFEVSMTIGAIAGNCTEDEFITLVNFNDALGIAYQIQDDIQDFQCNNISNSLSFLNSLAEELNFTEINEENLSIIKDEAQRLLEHYKILSLNSISSIGNKYLKSHLFRLIFKILSNNTQNQLSNTNHHNSVHTYKGSVENAY